MRAKVLGFVGGGGACSNGILVGWTMEVLADVWSLMSELGAAYGRLCRRSIFAETFAE